MENRNIVTFLRAAELKSFTKAAEDLGYAQSTVTLQIQQLEREIGAPLFERIGRKIALTPAGELLVVYANEMMRLEYKIRQIGGSQDRIAGTLRIGVLESLLSSYLAKHLAGFHSRFPDIMLEIRAEASSDLIKQLRHNDLDLVLVLGRQYVDEDLVRDFTCAERVFFVTNASNPLLKKENISFYDIVQQPLILPERISLYRQAIEEIAAEYDCVLTPVIQLNNTSTIVKLLLEGPGVSVLPNYLVRSYLAEHRLSILQTQNVRMQTLHVQLIHHKNKWVTPQMERFISLIKETYMVS